MNLKLQLFRSKNFLPLFISQFCGAFNDNVFKSSLLIWVTYYLSQKIEIDVKIILPLASLLFILPFMLFSSISGQISDNFEKAKVAKIVKFSEIMIMSAIFLGFYYENLIFLLFLLFLMGAQSTFFGPIKYSLLPIHLKKEELIAGNSFIEAGTFLAILFGTIFGSILINTEYGKEIVSISVVIFAISGFISSIFIPKTSIEDKENKMDFNILKSTLNIIKLANKNKSIWLSIILISWFWFIGTIFLTQFPFYVKNIINGNEKIVTLFLSLFSIGVAFGSFICNKLSKNKIELKLSRLGLIGIIISILIFSITSYFYEKNITMISFEEFFYGLELMNFLIIASLFLMASFAGIYIVPLYSNLQNRSDKKFISRMIATNNIVNAFFMVFSSIISIALFRIGFKLVDLFFILVAMSSVMILVVNRLLSKSNS